MHFSVVKVRKQAKGATQLFVLHGGDKHPHSYKGRGELLLCCLFPLLFLSSMVWLYLADALYLSLLSAALHA